METNVDGEGRIKGTIQRLQAEYVSRHFINVPNLHPPSMQRLDNESHRKLQHLQGRDADCADTVSWLRQNQHQFQFPVMEPPIMSMTVTDQRYAASVESLFSWTQLKVGLVSLRLNFTEAGPRHLSVNATKTIGCSCVWLLIRAAR